MVSATLPIDAASLPEVCEPSEASLLADLARAVELIRGVVRRPVPVGLSGATARAFVHSFSEAERAAASGVALFTPVVVESGDYAKEGHGSAADWLGHVSGSSAGSAKGRLAAAERAARDPLLTEALHESELSTDQLKLVTKAMAEVPGASGDLLELVEQGASHQELASAADHMRAASRSQETERLRRARVHAQRHFRWHQDESGGIRGEFLCDEVGWARVAPMLESEAKARWKAAGGLGGGGLGGGTSDSLEAHRLDAFLDLMTGSPGGSAPGARPGEGPDPEPGAGPSAGPGPGAGPRSRHGTRPRTLIIVNAESLRRGTTAGDETCEIEGIGPVSVAAARELLSEGAFQYLVKEGFDIRTATRSTRVITNCVEMALVARDRVCAVPGCGKRLGLEQDHWRVDYGKAGPTELDNLVRLCPEHHALKTHGGWRLEGEPGAWKWVPPRKPKSARYIVRARRLAAAKAKAKAKTKTNRSGPQRPDP